MKKVVFLSVIGTLYKKTEADVADHLKTVEGDEIEDSIVQTVLKELDAEKVSTFKEEAKIRFDNGVKKGVKDTAKKFESKLKETFEIEEDDLEGDDLLSKVEEVAKANKSKGGEGNQIDFSKITPEDLEKVPAFINKKRDFEKQLKEKDAEKENAVNTVKNEIKTSTIKNKASNLALAKLLEKNPILPSDAKKAEKMKNKLLIEEIKNLSFMEGDDGSLIPLDEEGKPKTNANGITIDFDTLVEEIIDNNFEFAKSEERKSPQGGSGGSGGSSSTKYTGKAPASKQEYMQLLTSSDLSTEEKASVKEQYREQFA